MRKALVLFISLYSALALSDLSDQTDVNEIERALITGKKQHTFKLNDVNSVEEHLQHLERYETKIIKHSKRSHDAYLIRLTNKANGDQLALKIHPETFPIASHSYQEDNLERVNNSGATAKVLKTFLLPQEKEIYRIVMYPFVEGTLLNQVLNDKEKVVKEMEKLLKKLIKAGYFLRFYEAADFLMTKDDEIILTDWDILVDVRDSTHYSRDRFIPALRPFIEEFIDQEIEKERIRCGVYLPNP